MTGDLLDVFIEGHCEHRSQYPIPGLTDVESEEAGLSARSRVRSH